MDGTYKQVTAGSLKRRILAGDTINVAHTIVTKGPLNLSQLHVQQALSIKDSIVQGGADLSDATFSRPIDLTDTYFDGSVKVDRALFKSDATWNRARFCQEFSHTLVTTLGSISFNGAEFYQKADFSRSTIGQDAAFESANFKLKKDTADFLAMFVNHWAWFNGAIFSGGIAFERAEIGESLYFGQVKGAIIEGGANFHGTKVGAQANFIGVTFKGEARMSMSSFHDARFDGAQFLSAPNPKDNEISFLDAQYQIVSFGGDNTLAYIAPGRRVLLSGFRYARVSTPPSEMLGILAKLAPYDRGPYSDLERLYRNAGRLDAADDVYYARRLREAMSMPNHAVLRVVWDRIQRYVFGYGVKMAAPIIWVAAIIVTNVAILFCSGALERRPAPIEEGGVTYALLARRRRSFSKEFEHRPLPRVAPRVTNASLEVGNRFYTALRVAVGMLIPGVDAIDARDWEVSNSRIQVLGSRIPLSYKAFVSGAKFLTWVIVTIGVSLFTVTDWIRN